MSDKSICTNWLWQTMYENYLYRPQHPHRTFQLSVSIGHSRRCASTGATGSSIHLEHSIQTGYSPAGHTASPEHSPHLHGSCGTDQQGFGHGGLSHLLTVSSLQTDGPRYHLLGVNRTVLCTFILTGWRASSRFLHIWRISPESSNTALMKSENSSGRTYENVH